MPWVLPYCVLSISSSFAWRSHPLLQITSLLSMQPSDYLLFRPFLRPIEPSQTVLRVPA